MDLQNNNSSGNVAETFFFDALSISSPFVQSTDLTQSFTASSFDFSLGTFTILDTGPNVIASGDFMLDSLTLNGPTAAATPLPAALPLFASGIGGLGLLSWRRKRKAQATA
jgi:hypothetical protein